MPFKMDSNTVTPNNIYADISFDGDSEIAAEENEVLCKMDASTSTSNHVYHEDLEIVAEEEHEINKTCISSEDKLYGYSCTPELAKESAVTLSDSEFRKMKVHLLAIGGLPNRNDNVNMCKQMSHRRSPWNKNCECEDCEIFLEENIVKKFNFPTEKTGSSFKVRRFFRQIFFSGSYDIWQNAGTKDQTENVKLVKFSCLPTCSSKWKYIF